MVDHTSRSCKIANHVSHCDVLSCITRLIGAQSCVTQIVLGLSRIRQIPFASLFDWLVRVPCMAYARLHSVPVMPKIFVVVFCPYNPLKSWHLPSLSKQTKSIFFHINTKQLNLKPFTLHVMWICVVSSWVSWILFLNTLNISVQVQWKPGKKGRGRLARIWPSPSEVVCALRYKNNM